GSSGQDVLLSWSALANASWYDVVSGRLSTLQSTGGDFAVSTEQCAAERLTGTSHLVTGLSPSHPCQAGVRDRRSLPGGEWSREVQLRASQTARCTRRHGPQLPASVGGARPFPPVNQSVLPA